MAIAMRHVVKFPANVLATKGVYVTRANGKYTFKLDYADLAPAASVASNVKVAFQDPVTGEMGSTTLSSALNSNANIQAIANADTEPDQIGYWNGTASYVLTDFTAFGRTLAGSSDDNAARTSLGLNNVDNTADADKPISTATQTALNGKASAAQGAKADSAVQPGDLGALAVKDKAAIADISAAGTADGSHFLRGDGIWGVPGGGGDVLAADIYAADRAALSALSGVTSPLVYLKETGRAGDFQWNSGDLSAQVTADPQQGIYVAPSSDATGASGAWVRRFDGGLWTEWFGTTGDGTANDTTALQAAIDATPEGGILALRSRNYKITTALSVSKAITLVGSTQYVTSILCVGCSGLEIDAINNVQIKNIEFAASVRHTTTPNSYVGISVDGSDGARPTNHIYRDVFLDGFKTGYSSNYLWSSVFDNLRVGHCESALHATGLSVNNVVTKCGFGGDGAGNGLYLDGGTVASEGWMVSDTLIDNFAIGVYGNGYANVYINNCIIDHNYVNGVRIDSSATDFGGNWTIRGNYVAMTGASGDAAIKSNNAISNTANQGNIITDNQILAYAGSTCVRGIHMSGSQALNNVIRGNTIRNFTTADIRNSVGPDIVTGNNCLSSIATNINVVGNSIVHNNKGVIAFAEFAQYITLGQNKVTWSYDIPTSGTWTQGDICWKSNISAGGIPGWVCVSGGTPGTWKEMAAVAS